MTTPAIFTSNVNVTDEPAYAEAYGKVEGELKALPADQLVLPNTDVPRAISTALGAKPKIVAIQPSILEVIPKFDVKLIENLETYAFALNHANIAYMTATQSPDDLPALLEEGTGMRDRYRSAATSLEQWGLLNPAALKQYKGLKGYRNVAMDLQVLVRVFKENWAAVNGKSAITEADLDRAQRVAERMIRLVGLREQSPAAVADTSDMRARAFTLFTSCYDQIRRAVVFVRWDQGDADEIAPSLYAGKTRSTADDQQPAAPAAGAAPAPAPSPAPAAPAPQQAATPRIPGGSPFVQ